MYFSLPSCVVHVQPSQTSSDHSNKILVNSEAVLFRILLTLPLERACSPQYPVLNVSIL